MVSEDNQTFGLANKIIVYTKHTVQLYEWTMWMVRLTNDQPRHVLRIILENNYTLCRGNRSF